MSWEPSRAFREDTDQKQICQYDLEKFCPKSNVLYNTRI